MIVLFWMGSLMSESGCRCGYNDGNDARPIGSVESHNRIGNVGEARLSRRMFRDGMNGED